MNIPNNKILQLFKRHPYTLTAWLCEFYPLRVEQISVHKEKILWSSLSKNKKINWTNDFIRQYKENLSWDSCLLGNPALPWSIDFIQEHIHLMRSETAISGNEGIPWSYELIDKFRDLWNYHWLETNPSVNWTEKMIVDFEMFDRLPSKINGDNLWTVDFIMKYKEKFNWTNLCLNPYLPWSEELIDHLTPTFNSWRDESSNSSINPWLFLGENPALPWSIPFIKKYLEKPGQKKDGLSLAFLSCNEGLPWGDGLIDEFFSRWEWKSISVNNGINFSERQIDKYQKVIAWDTEVTGYKSIALNTSLPWSEAFIEKYEHQWNWWSLSMNPAIPFTEQMIEKYLSRWNRIALFTNPALPWSFSFLEQHEKECFDLWLTYDDVNEEVWETVFMPILNDQLVDEILTAMPPAKLNSKF